MKRVVIALVLLIAMTGSTLADEYAWVEGEDATAETFNNHSWFQNDSSVKKHLLSPGVPETTPGEWIAHYASGNSPAYAEYEFHITEGGEYTWWIRLASRKSAYTYSLDGGAAQSLSLTHRHEEQCIIRPSINDVHYIAWVRAGTLSLTPGAHTLRVNVTYGDPGGDRTLGGIDCMYFVNYDAPPAGSLKPDSGPTPGADVWFPLRIDADEFDGNSIIDMQGVLAASSGVPAGVHGHVQRVDSHFELSGRPGVPVKFWGVCGVHPDDESLFDQQARLYAKHGVNLVRRHYMLAEIGEGRNASALDTYDQWFAALKENGVYTNWSVFYPDNSGMFLSEDFLPDTLAPEFEDLLSRAGVTMADLWDELPASGARRKVGGFDNFVWAYQEGLREWLEPLMLHENPYTGMRYVDDPALAIIEVQNEDGLFWHWPLNPLATGTEYPNHTLLLKRMWFEWLGQKYAEDDELEAAWGAGMRAEDSVETFDSDIKVYGAWEMEADGPFFNKSTEKARMGDWIQFLAETQRQHYQDRFQFLRDLGYEGVVMSTAWKAGGPAAAAANLWVDDCGDAIDRHAYFGGGVGGHYVATGSVNNGTHLTQPGYGILGGESIDAGGQDVSAFQVEDKPCLMTEWNSNPPNQWRGEISPLYAFYGMGLQGWDGSLHFSGSYAWMESGWPGAGFGPSSYVNETPLYLAQFPALAFAIYKGHIQEADAAAARRLSLDDLFGGIDPLSQDLPGGGYPGEDNLYTPPEVTAIGRLSFKADDAYTSSDSEKVDWATYWDDVAEVITSMTGELVWDYGDGIVQIRSPKTQGIVGFAGGGSYDLPGVEVDVGTDFVSLIFTPLDDRPLIDSEHVLITALAQDKQVGTEYNGDGSELLTLGGPPLLLQPVQAEITFKGGTVESAKVVDVYGVPTETDVERTGNTVTIDGRYQTYYYEVRRQTATTPRIALSTTSLAPTCREGEDADDQTFDVWNSAIETLEYAITDDAAWLSVSPASGSSTGSGDAGTHTVSYDTSALSAGTYAATIAIADDDADNSPQTLAVELTVYRQPAIGLSTTSLSPTTIQNVKPADDTFQVWNAGFDTLEYTISDDVTWLTVSPASGSSTGDLDAVTHTVGYTVTGMAPGTYTATVTIAAPSAENTPQIIDVELTVLMAPQIGVEPTSLAPTGVAGTNAPDDTLEIWNAGESLLSYAVSDDAAWLSVAPATGASTGDTDRTTHTVEYSTAGLGTGTYTATVSIEAAGATNSPRLVPATLTVEPPTTIACTPTSFNVTCAEGSNANDGTVRISNAGSGTLDYTVVDSAGWLTVSPDSGASTGQDDPQVHTLQFATAGLSAGLYTASITVSDPAAANSPLTVPVTLTVEDRTPPLVEITWPRESDGPLGDYMITVEGTADDSAAIEAIWINGILATPTAPNFATWEATIPVNQGWDSEDPNCACTIVACALDQHGNVAPEADSVTVDSIGEAGVVTDGSGNMKVMGASVPGDADCYQFAALAGARAKIALKAKGDPDPNLTLGLYGPWGELLLEQTGNRLKLQGDLPESGLYTVVVTTASGPGGMYQLQVKVKDPKSKLKEEGFISTSDERDDYAMPATGGAEFIAKVQSSAFQPLLMILDPAGGVIPIGGYEKVSTGKMMVKKVPAPLLSAPYQTGNYVVRVGSADGNTGAYKLVCAVKPPKANKAKIEHPVLVKHSAGKGIAPGEALELKVIGASRVLGDNTVYLGGRELTPQDGALRGGKGVLVVTVPADMPSGPAWLYFVAGPEKSNAKAIQVLR